MSRLLINNVVIYDPTERTLTHALQLYADPIYLTNKENLILNELMRGVTSKSALVDAAWPEKNGDISDSSFYKTVYMLRKNLQSIGLGKDIIRTRSGYGLLFGAEVAPIADMEERQSSPLVVENESKSSSVARVQTHDGEIDLRPVSALIKKVTSNVFFVPSFISCISIIAILCLVLVAQFSHPVNSPIWKEWKRENNVIFYTQNGLNVDLNRMEANMMPILPKLPDSGELFLIETPISQTISHCQPADEITPCVNFFSIGY